MIAFGPVPSRRLGRSLGINNIPPKLCNYSCVYCQVGRTLNYQVERRSFYDPIIIQKEVQDKIEKTKEMGEAIDYLTFVPDGEPTLDANLDRTIVLLKPLGIKIAVISNGSLMGDKDVREGLVKTDWVSFKVDSTTKEIWRKTNRPYRSLEPDTILDGILEFKKVYEGTLVTETMLVRGVNDGDENLSAVASFLSVLKPTAAYISIPARPPAETWVLPPSEEVINKVYQIFSKRVDRVEYLIGYEGNAFAFTGNAEQDLLSIAAVHPMRHEAVRDFLKRAKAGWSVVRRLLDQNQLTEMEYEGQKFYTRRFPKRSSN